jgi:hypothetical protein
MGSHYARLDKLSQGGRSVSIDHHTQSIGSIKDFWILTSSFGASKVFIRTNTESFVVAFRSAIFAF